MERRHRLSRSRDFDAVYRRGRSVSTRSLTLHWFAREDDDDGVRVGLAVPRTVGTAVARNRLNRQLRDAWASVADKAPDGRDYVIVARPGLAEAAAARGADWLVEQVREAIGKVQA